MATAVIMPRQGQSVESCIIAKWHKKVGDTVAPGDILFSYETDKASFEEESKLSGTMLDIFFEEGDDVPCLTNVCVIGNPGESTAQFKPAGEEEEATAASEDSAPAEETAQTAPAQTVSRSADEFIKISPRAKNLAARQGVDYTVAPATGPNGRIIERDIDAMIASGNAATFAARDGFVGSGAGIEGTGIGGRVRMADLNAPAAPAAAAAAVADEGPEYVDVPMTNIRKVIAKNMIHSLSTIAQLTYNMHFDMTAVNAFRGLVKAGGEALNVGKITINDVILYAVSRILKNHPDFNAHCVDNKVRQFTHVHLGVAVDTERGLMVPTIRNADCKSLSEIAKEAKELAAACQKGSIAPDLLSGGTFTVSNLGSLGMESFTPVINPPQTAILGVNTIETKVRVVNGEIKTYPAMNLSLTADHRVIDGAPASRFLKELVTALENFTVLLAK